MLYFPARVLLLGFCAYVLILLIAPVTPTVSIELGSVLFIGLCCLSFWAGSRFAGASPPVIHYRRRTPDWMRKRAKLLFLSTFVLGALGDVLKAVDTYYIRSSSGLDALEVRAELGDTEAGPLSMVAGVIYPLGFIPLLIYLGMPHIGRSRIRLLLAIMLFLVPTVDALALLSRTSLMTALGMIYFGTVLTKFSGQAFPKPVRWPTFVLVMGFAVVSSVVFSVRLDGMGIDLIDSIYASAYGYTVTPNAWAQEVMQRGSGYLSSLTVWAMPLFQYYTHSLFEFQLIWAQGDFQMHSYGALHLGPYLKAMSIFGLGDEVDSFTLFPRVGVFTSFFGPLWIDFGWFSPLIMLIFGFGARRLGMASSRGDVGAQPLYIFICLVVFFAPVYDVLVGKGMYTFNSFMVFWLVSRHYARSHVRDVLPVPSESRSSADLYTALPVAAGSAS